jgi:predicted DNA-binding transcriptional regulator AlpA
MNYPDTRKADPASAAAHPESLAGAPLLLDANQAAGLCGVSRSRWNWLWGNGRCPAPVRLSGTCVRWRTQELRAWVDAGCPHRSTWEARPPHAPLLLDANQAAALCRVSRGRWRWMFGTRLCPAPAYQTITCAYWAAAELRAWTDAGCPRREVWEARRASMRHRQPSPQESRRSESDDGDAGPSAKWPGK